MDTVLGDLSVDFADELAVGASESHDFEYEVTGEARTVHNVVTARPIGVDSVET